MGAFIPGFVLSGLYMLYIGIRSYFQPEMAPASTEDEKLSFGKKTSMLFSSIGPVAILIFSVMGSIYFGLASPSEAAAVGAAAATILTIVYGHFTWNCLL